MELAGTYEKLGLTKSEAQSLYQEIYDNALSRGHSETYAALVAETFARTRPEKHRNGDGD